MAIDSTTEEIIHYAGALLCDRALAGWHVVAVGNNDVRSLRTIGAEAVASISRLEVQTSIHHRCLSVAHSVNGFGYIRR
jgi:hypothetical protein